MKWMSPPIGAHHKSNDDDNGMITSRRGSARQSQLKLIYKVLSVNKQITFQTDKTTNTLAPQTRTHPETERREVEVILYFANCLLHIRNR